MPRIANVQSLSSCSRAPKANHLSLIVDDEMAVNIHFGELNACENDTSFIQLHQWLFEA